MAVKELSKMVVDAVGASDRADRANRAYTGGTGLACSSSVKSGHLGVSNKQKCELISE